MYYVLNDIQLTKNFRLSEFVCHDGSDEVMLNGKLIELLQLLREELQQPITVAAGYRNKSHNLVVGGSPNSRHLIGDAADIKVRLISPRAVALVAQRLGFNGIGVYTNNGDYFTHLDVRTLPSYWHDNRNTKTLTAVKTIKEI